MRRPESISPWDRRRGRCRPRSSCRSPSRPRAVPCQQSGVTCLELEPAVMVATVERIRFRYSLPFAPGSAELPPLRHNSDEGEINGAPANICSVPRNPSSSETNSKTLGGPNDHCLSLHQLLQRWKLKAVTQSHVHACDPKSLVAFNHRNKNYFFGEQM